MRNLNEIQTNRLSHFVAHTRMLQMNPLSVWRLVRLQPIRIFTRTEVRIMLIKRFPIVSAYLIQVNYCSYIECTSDLWLNKILHLTLTACLFASHSGYSRMA